MNEGSFAMRDELKGILITAGAFALGWGLFVLVF
jgi:hypothetical protein